MCQNQDYFYVHCDKYRNYMEHMCPKARLASAILLIIALYSQLFTLRFTSFIEVTLRSGHVETRSCCHH